MKLRLFFSLFIAVGGFSSYSFALSGNGAGNGGDSVACTPTDTNPYVGWYSLDYIIDKTAEVEFSNEFDEVIGPNEPFDKNFQRILAALKEKKYGFLYEDLNEFYEGLWSNSFSARFTWKKAPYGTISIDDQGVLESLPPNCVGTGRKPSLIQTIIRNDRPYDWEMKINPPVYMGGDISQGPQYSFDSRAADFVYSTEVVNDLPPLQLSFLLFHEWLRNYTNDPEVLRDANAVLHSAGWTGDDIDKKVAVLGTVMHSSNAFRNFWYYKWK